MVDGISKIKETLISSARSRNLIVNEKVEMGTALLGQEIKQKNSENGLPRYVVNKKIERNTLVEP